MWFNYVIKAWLLPPGLIIALLLALACLVEAGRRRWLLSVAGLLWALSTPLVANYLMSTVEDVQPLSLTDLAAVSDDAEVIVVLGGGLYHNAPDYQGTTVDISTLVRVRYGAYLHKRTGLPVAVSGGALFGSERSEADVMARVLEEEFDVPVTWRESHSLNTEQNAQCTARQLIPLGHRRIVLVTQAYHMRRAMTAFQAVGFDVIPAPTLYATTDASDHQMLALLPGAGSLYLSATALHEWLGGAFYRLTGYRVSEAVC